MERLKAGDWIEVRSREEILATLDERGQLDGMPFMPEMFAYCGQRMRVRARAHKTCDTVFPIRGRRLTDSVHLETRCDGSAHGGCQAACLLFWKEAWLRRPEAEGGAKLSSIEAAQPARPGDAGGTRCTEENVRASATVPGADADNPTYVCQATRLPYATSRLEWWDVRQYIEDFTSGNVGIRRILSGLVYSIYYNLSESRLRLRRPMRWLYDKLHRLWGGPRFPRLTGTIPDDKPTPSMSLNLQPGELVKVRPHEEILKTITKGSKNRGMYWDAEMVPFCGGTYRVQSRVTRIIDEKTGRMLEMKNPCIILESVTCQARYSACRMFCPRAIYPYWREIWLERVGPRSNADAMESKGAAQ